MVVCTGWNGPRDAAVVEASLPTGTITLARPVDGAAAGSNGGTALATLPYGPGDTFFLDMDSNEWVRFGAAVKTSTLRLTCSASLPCAPLRCCRQVQPHIAGQPPLYRYGSSMVAAGPAALLWGGWESGRPMNDLFLLDLSALAAVVAAPT
jgi:hypothetical protein